VPKAFPIRIVWRNEEGKTRTKGFDLLPRALSFQKALREHGAESNCYVQGEIFGREVSLSQQTYSQSDDIPY
jgi:hypothetical protein